MIGLVTLVFRGLRGLMGLAGLGCLVFRSSGLGFRV